MHVLELVWDFHIVLAAVPDASHTCSGVPQSCQVPYNSSQGPLDLAIQDSGYSDCWLQCPHQQQVKLVSENGPHTPIIFHTLHE
jgi:hypothetical protein